ncbi:hypothetical protein EIN_051190 [Entamoeba invadens IP1]|uniref:Uncharacterized protein n=1 Tax=Entamoeba invadens IP1 TaxID=370355 RepID=L7FNM5_ENTIV|nr:hypothetical protein EIN_051190 [Entamoeba invadens IP1]ELP88622.1 hypothetical protein EIN_051190 [Entamoeba invadens IP1]|eukprot:XP_004255393.1 hypothetical protein EIN_051190 [Entamoeba invadens IP1]
MGSSVVSRLVGMKYPIGVMSQKDDVEDEVKKATKRRKMEILELRDQDGAIDAAKLEELSVCMVTKRVVEIIQSFKIACVNNNTSAFHMCSYVKSQLEKKKRVLMMSEFFTVGSMPSEYESFWANRFA